MKNLLTNVEFWKAIISLAWPLVAICALFKFWPLLVGILKRENMTIKVAGLELSVQEATKGQGRDIADLQERLSNVEQALQNGEHIASNEPGQKPADVEKEAEPTQSKLLLWVDDYPSNNAFLIEGMQQKGVEIVLSLSTADALEKVAETHFEAIITDLGRVENGTDDPFAGLNLIKKLRERGDGTPVLVFAGQRGIQNKRKLMAAGAEEVTSSGIDVMSFVSRHIGI